MPPLGGLRFCGAGFLGGDDGDGGDDDRGGDEGARADRFGEEEPAEEDGDDGIYVGVGGDAGGRAVAHQPDEGRETDERTQADEVGEGTPGAWRDGGELEGGEIAVNESGDEEGAPPPSIWREEARKGSAPCLAWRE